MNNAWAAAVVCGVVLTTTGAVAGQATWQNELSLSYSQAAGNTSNSRLLAGYEGLRKTARDELGLKASILNSRQNKKMDGQKSFASARYAPFLSDSQWFTFAKTEVSHDRFAFIDYRVLPSVGAGYSFSDTEDWKLTTEVGFGYEYTKYTSGDDDEALVLIPRLFAEKQLFDTATLSQEIVYFPSLERADVFRARSETRFTNSLSEALALRLSLINEYNSSPLGQAKKTDTELNAAIVYAF